MTQPGGQQAVSAPPTAAGRYGVPTANNPPGRTIPGTYQIVIGLYIIFTGAVPTLIQALAFGIDKSGGYEFGIAMMTELGRDFLLLAAVVALSRQAAGILHPLILAIVIWPMLVAMPAKIESFGGWAGVLAGLPVETPAFAGLPGYSPGQVWMAIAKFNSLEMLRIVATYAGFALIGARPKPGRISILPRPESVRTAMVVLVVVSILILLYFVRERGGVSSHLTSLGNGRFRELGGEGIILVLIQVGAIALYVWTAARPKDVRKPWFIAAALCVFAVQFISNGSRSSALTVPMMLALVWALRTRRIPWRPALLAAPLMFVALGTLNAVRTASWSGQNAGQVLEGATFADSFLLAQEEIAARRKLAASVPIVARGFEVTQGPMLGRSYLAAILAPVPRSLWRDKPRGPDSLYAQLFLHEKVAGTAIPVGETDELYWNFGIPGLIILSLIYGWLLRLAYHAFARRYPHPIVIVAFALFITGFHFSTGRLVTLEQQLGLLMICALIVAQLAKVRVGGPGPRRQAPAFGGGPPAQQIRPPATQ